MTKRTARLSAVAVTGAALVAVSAAAASAGSVSESYDHEVTASTEHVSYSESEHYCYSSEDEGREPTAYGRHHSGFGHGLLGRGLGHPLTRHHPATTA
ncbi:hypothetical protein AB0K51_31785 [Kitasatospora sp. NPDC049285]|uniref:hypothetical protein n=1 Tax=Kitasatospora sp. NPDC049285 TaxID=3157096 RepID=UPI003442E805